MGETFISIPVEILNNFTNKVGKLTPVNVNKEDTVDTIEEKRLNDVTEPVEKLPNDARLENIYNETIVDMEIAEGLKQERITTELLKDIFNTTDDRLRGHSENINDIEGKRKLPRTYLNVDHGSRWNKNPVWVQFQMRGEYSGEVIDGEDRRPFLLKVFSLLFVCMLVTFIFAVITFVVPGIRPFFEGSLGYILGIAGMTLVLGVSCKLICCQYGRRCPCNILGIIGAVIGECLVFGYITARFQLEFVLLALAITCALVLVCLGLALTPLDFTKWYLYVIIFGVALVLFSLVVSIVTFALGLRLPILHLVIAFVSIIFFSVCFIMELQMVLGGKTVELGDHDYVVGTLLLYTSMMTMFFTILRIIGILDVGF